MWVYAKPQTRARATTNKHLGPREGLRRSSLWPQQYQATLMATWDRAASCTLFLKKKKKNQFPAPPSTHPSSPSPTEDLGLQKNCPYLHYFNRQEAQLASRKREVQAVELCREKYLQTGFP